ncbi:NACHT, LRR and PYD domains-containing protein 1a-like [Aquarana catesbeiana]|uniref:NACHT, LRR and PYD domains-containing protein 1a-like n=1 Tax=Aquarana catesbeiana TaxID=8400 RepID=UPI003CCA01C1
MAGESSKWWKPSGGINRLKGISRPEDIVSFRRQLSAYDDPSLRRIHEYYKDDLIYILENIKPYVVLMKLKFHNVLNTDKYLSMEKDPSSLSRTLLQDIQDLGRKAVIGLWERLYELQKSHPNLLAVLDEITQRGKGLVDQILLDELGHSLTQQLRDIQEKHKQHLMEMTETLVEHRPPGTTLEPQRFLINERYVNLIVVSTDQFRQRPQNELIQTEVKHEEYLKKTQTGPQHISSNRLFRWNPQSQCVPHAVMVSGVPGIGKTTMMQKFVYDWVTGKHYQRFAFLFFFRFRDLNRLGEVSLEEMILHQYPYLESQIGNILEDPERILFIFDGLDESIHQMDFTSNKLSNPKQRSHFGEIVVSLMWQSLLKGCSVLMTSRPTGLASVDTRVFQRITEIMGFLHGDRRIFFNNFFGNEELSEKAFHYVEENDTLYTFCYIPSYCWIICTMLLMCFRSQPKITDQLMTSLPKTVTQLFVTFVSNILSNHCQNKDGGHTARELLTSIGWMAEHGVMNHMIVFDDRHLESFSVRNDNHVFSSFMIESGRPPDVDYTFLHLTLQEFFAALVHFISYNPERLQKTLDKAESYKDGRAEIFLRFLCGLSDSSTRSMLKSHVGELSTQAARHVITWIQKKIPEQRPDKSRRGNRELLNVFYYVHESRNKALVPQCIGSHKIDFSGVPLSPVECSVLSFILQSCRETEVDLKSCNIHSEGLRKLIPALHNIKSLRLEMNRLTDSSCPHLASGIRNNRTLRTLDLSFNNLEGPHFRDLMEALTTSQIEELQLQDVGLTDEYTPFLVSLSNCTSLTVLDLRDNRFTDASIGYIEDLILTSTSLKEVRTDGSRLSYHSKEIIRKIIHEIHENAPSKLPQSGYGEQEEAMVTSDASAESEEPPDNLVTPTVRGKIYRLELKPGRLFCCTETGIKFQVKSQVTITYDLEFLSGTVNKIQKEGYYIVGPMFNITVDPDVVSAVHLPHYLHLQGLKRGISLIRCGNFKDGIFNIIKHQTIGPSHIVLENPSFSSLFVLLLNLWRGPIPFEGKALLYGKVVCPEDVKFLEYKFHLHVIPRNQLEIKKLHEHKKSYGFQDMGKPHLMKSGVYTKTGYTVSVQPNGRICPKVLQLEIGNELEDLPFVEVIVDRNSKELLMFMSLNGSDDPLWEGEVTEGELREMQLRACASVSNAGSSPSTKHFVDIHFGKLVQGVSNVNEVLDKLKFQELLTNEQCDIVRAQSTSQEQMRELFTAVKGWGNDDKDKLLSVLKETNQPLINGL